METCLDTKSVFCKKLIPSNLLFSSYKSTPDPLCNFAFSNSA